MFSSIFNRFIHSTAMLALAVGFMSQAKAENYSDIWYNPDEAGWGVTIADHNTNIFAVWLTYREDNMPTWFVIPGGVLSDDRRTFSASIYSTNAPLDTNPAKPSKQTQWSRAERSKQLKTQAKTSLACADDADRQGPKRRRHRESSPSALS